MSQGSISGKSDSHSTKNHNGSGARTSPVGRAAPGGRPSVAQMRENFSQRYQSNANHLHNDQMQWSHELEEDHKNSSDQWMTSVDNFASILNEG